MAGNKKFDIDLKYGQIRENKVREMFSKCQIEVKSERSWWKKTGNIAIEYEYRGKPSGIYATTSDYWFHRLEGDRDEFCTLVFKTSILKGIVDKYKDKLTKNVGDNKASKCVLIPIKDIFNKEFYGNV
jgi:hypothetical protein|tara:strand:- start:613 stop:996 length:384 start_codon:yes stop_codon:yes gene_type:complete